MNAGDIVLVKFPFSDLETTKKRPALVLGAVSLKSLSLVTIAMITSKIDGIQLPGDVELEDWKQAGLLHPSIVRLSKVATLEHGLIEKRLGKLSRGDFAQLAKVFRKAFSSWL